MTSFLTSVDGALNKLSAAGAGAQGMLERFNAEIKFAEKLAQANPDQQAAWEGLILRAVQIVEEALAQGTAIADAVVKGEAVLAPLGAAAKAYTIHCVGHAHIDMNWMWNWPETVATVNDTFTTVDRLMDEFPDFIFSQSQASVYRILKDYLPELYERVKTRVKEGRWEITASQWVEGDKNLASGEIICRHLLYTRRFFAEEFGLPYDAVTVDWEPDTFGHPHSLPGILARGGVKHYYFHRGHDRTPWLFWWQGQDGSRVLAFDDYRRGYNGVFNGDIANMLFDFETQTGLKDFLFVYGVGDHGGGPTRRDLVMAHTMMAWPIFPTIKLSTVSAFFAIAEKAKNLAVLDDEMNFILEGCYTAQSNIKRANRASENALVEAEIYALLGQAQAGLPYPSDELYTGWRDAMFNQFHDILPGSGVHATYEHAQGLFQEIMATTTMVKTRALRAIAGKVDTLGTCGCQPAGNALGAGVGVGIGAGQGDLKLDGGLSRYSTGGTCCDTFVIFNPSPWTRSEVLTVPLWDRDWQAGQIAIRDDAGNTYPAQYLDRNHFWGHNAVNIALPAQDVPALGYRTFSVMRSPEPGTVNAACTGNGRGTIENEFLRVVVDQESGAIAHLIDKTTGLDLVPEGEYLGVLEYVLEAPHGMSSWIYGQPIKTVQFIEGATIECPQNGPYQALVRSYHKYNDSTFTLTIAVTAGVPRVDFTLEMNWLERGHAGHGIPTLRAVFPLAIDNPTATYETPNGWVERPTDQTTLPSYTYEMLHRYAGGTPPLPQYPLMVPAQKWANLTGSRSETKQPVGATLLNTSKYGHSADGGTLRLDLVRSSYDPDPLPELGQHTIRFALQPHSGQRTPADAARAGYAFNLPFNVVNTGQHGGDLPATDSCLEVLTSNVLLSGLKKAEDGEGLIIRLYEIEGRETTARVRIAPCLLPSTAVVVETDVLERPLPQSSPVLAGDILTAQLPPYGTVTLRIG
jgi:alpha-mannosidase